MKHGRSAIVPVLLPAKTYFCGGGVQTESLADNTSAAAVERLVANP